MIKIALYNKEAHLLFMEEQESYIHVCVHHIYEDGDYIVIIVPAGNFLTIRLDEAVDPAMVYAREDNFVYRIPFGNEKEAYSPGAFIGEYHLYTVILQKKETRRESRDLSTNPWDIRGESGFFPHCTASTETSGESVFAARNTIDGLKETNCHGIWPYTSWGDSEDPDAEIKIEFGREIIAEELRINLRSDYPHDNYWQQAELAFSDDSILPISMKKTGCDQVFALNGRKTEFLKMRKLIRCRELKSPFPALTFWQVTGREID